MREQLLSISIQLWRVQAGYLTMIARRKHRMLASMFTSYYEFVGIARAVARLRARALLAVCRRAWATWQAWRSKRALVCKVVHISNKYKYLYVLKHWRAFKPDLIVALKRAPRLQLQPVTGITIEPVPISTTEPVQEQPRQARPRKQRVATQLPDMCACVRRFAAPGPLGPPVSASADFVCTDHWVRRVHAANALAASVPDAQKPLFLGMLVCRCEVCVLSHFSGGMTGMCPYQCCSHS